MLRRILAVGVLMMSGSADAITVLDTRLAATSPRHDPVVALDIVAMSVRDYHPESADPVRSVAADIGTVSASANAHRSASPNSGGSEVPDVVTWGLMIIGFGYVGLAASRRQPAVAA